MMKIKLTNIIGAVMLLHSVSGAFLNILKNPYGADLNTCVVEALGGYGLIRSRKATTEVEKKIDSHVGLDDPQ